MDEVKEILKKCQEKEITIEEAERLLRADMIEKVGDLAQLDIFRKARTGVPEVVYAQNKDPQMVIDIINSFIKKNEFAIVSRYTQEQQVLIQKNFENNNDYKIEVNELGKIIIIKENSFNFVEKKGRVGIITAGSSDIPVAEEAKVIVKVMGCMVFTSYDVGIAGFHRIFSPLSEMIKSGVFL